MARQLSLSHTQIVCEVRDETQVGAARRQIGRLAESHTLNELMTTHASIVATELASNMWKHAGGGELLIQHLSDESFEGLELLAIDRGPGIADISRSFEDGHSTAGTPGTGLGAARRLSRVFDVHSESGKGTVVMSRIGNHRVKRADTLSWGAVMTNAPGESVSGDQWSIARSSADGSMTLMVTDGLGHGLLAHDASAAAVRTFAAHPSEAPAALLRHLHQGLAATRGAAVALARMDVHTGTLTYAGIGNISGTIVRPDGKKHGLVSMNGIVGADPITIREFTYQWNHGDVLVMHSDGLRTHWSLGERVGLMARHPAIIAAVLHRDFLRGRDDATVIVLTR